MRDDETDLTDGDGGVPDPASMLTLLTEQQRRVNRALLAPVPWLYLVWGVTWLVGFALLWSASAGGNPWLRIPIVVAGTGFAVLIAGSTVASIIIGSRINRGVRGVSDFAGAVYGISWMLCGLATLVLGAGLAANGASGELLAVYFPSAFGLMAGTLYLAGAALWRDTGQLLIGIVLIVVSAAAPFAGQPTNNLVVAIGGGGIFLAAAVITWRRAGADRAQAHG